MSDTSIELSPQLVQALKAARNYIISTGANTSLGGTKLVDDIDQFLPKPAPVTKYPGVGVGVFVVRPSYDHNTPRSFDILLCKRKNSLGWGEGEWSLPGGKIDWMEDTTDAAIRETYEETRAIITKPEFIGYTNDKWPEFDKHYITLYFIAKAINTDIRNVEPDKCEDLRWVSIDGLYIGKMFTGIREIVTNNRDVFHKYRQPSTDEYN